MNRNNGVETISVTNAMTALILEFMSRPKGSKQIREQTLEQPFNLFSGNEFRPPKVKNEEHPRYWSSSITHYITEPVAKIINEDECKSEKFGRDIEM
ncbi:hypothetical protein KIN20_002370 [Parelaphostrongylus tenuis]|uniref:Uncharacterized protein n=1 Tax=Parelaphostrongylus tenuis TaxID=148309 RepID=A0AAD5QF91_PARTN|nr:hypothetical protein KIN20_002370 [Parelaphostrongylus tenuis]